ncbi:MAG: bifunctional glutamate N-acetyltransferase/amino-acid acetyltransferase ArgJ [Chloroflexi bacterium]|nr:bifunctional glutamate N-acetyltransferase/amino-acid acetyltransferase ArgJ [Chloroflexota bacterium]
MAEIKTTTKTVDLESLLPVKGFKAIGVSAGLRRSGKPDITLIVSETPCASAGVFTTNRVKAAPVLLCMDHLAKSGDQMQAIVINAANANACTGEQGLTNSQQTAQWVAEAIGCQPEQVYVMSTGVIGVQLPMDKIEYGVKTAAGELAEDGWALASRGIMTTDTHPKAISKQGSGYTITGIAKGSGMIAPNMATMLAFITTDAALPQPILQQALRDANNQSFNRICVDGDTSTNDTVLLMANGASGVDVSEGEAYDEFMALLTDMCIELGQMIVRDGEGATKFITIEVNGASDDASAHQIANTIAVSPLVKTAFYGGDANWGRIAMAAGRAGVEFDQTQMNLWFAAGKSFEDSLQVLANGMPTDYQEDDAAAIFAEEDIYVKLNVGNGSGQATVWTCDFSHEYVTINGDYRT